MYTDAPLTQNDRRLKTLLIFTTMIQFVILVICGRNAYTFESAPPPFLEFFHFTGHKILGYLVCVIKITTEIKVYVER